MYFSWDVIGQRRITRFVQMILFLIAALLVVENRDRGLHEAMNWHIRRETILADIRAGMPIPELVRRHCGFLYYECKGSVLPDRMRMLRDKQAGDFAQLKE